MKKILTFAWGILLFSGISLLAAPVPAERALEIGKKILAAQPATKAGTGQISIVWDGESSDVATKSSVQPAFYVIARDGGGFVIIAGDDNAQPVLAISPDGRFSTEGMPENVKWWMEQMKRYVRESKTQKPAVKEQWMRLAVTKSALPQTYISNEYMGSRTCEWDQAAPGNELAPTVTGQGQSIAGCLPLAMAEILTWHGWPNQGVGSSTAYNYISGNNQSVTVPSYDLAANLVIDNEGWEYLQALTTYSSYQSCTGSTLSNVQKLVYACGVILEAEFNDYEHGGTASSSADVPSAFGEHMGYNKAPNREFLSYQSSLAAWNNKLRTEITKRPVLYCGQSNSTGNDAGHAYVFDGYASFNYEKISMEVFHVNFGWGGACNGYYQSNYQDTDTDEGYVYDHDFEALFDFYPDKTGETYSISFVNSYGVPGLAYSDGYDASNWFFVLYALRNSGSTYNGKLVAKLIDRFGNEKAVFDVYENLHPVEGDPLTDIITDFQPGEMQFGLYLKAPDGTTAGFGDRIALYCSTNPEMTIFRQITGLNDGTVVCELPIVSNAFIKTQSSYRQNDWFRFELLNYDSVYAGSLWTIIDPDGVAFESMLQSERV